MKLSDLGRVVQQTVDSAAGKARDVGQKSKQAFDSTRETRELAAKHLADGFEATAPARSAALNLVTSQGAWGKSVPIDTGTETPFRVGYGQTLGTLAEAHTRLPANAPDGLELLGARGRVFGEASARTLSAALGVEGEAGAKVAGRGSGTSFDGDVASLGEAFIGARSRNAVEVGLLGASVGSETFVGAEAYLGETITGDTSTTMEAQVQAGFRAGARASVTAIGISAEERMDLGLRARVAAQRDLPLVGPVGERFAVRADALVGMTEGGHAKAGLTGVGAGGEWFAGAKAAIEGRAALTVAGTELAGLGLTAEGWVGLGAKADVGVGWDSEHHEVRAKVSGGLAVGVGGAASGEATFGGDGLAPIGGGDSENE